MMTKAKSKTLDRAKVEGNAKKNKESRAGLNGFRNLLIPHLLSFRQYTNRKPLKKTSSPPTIGTTKPRNDFGPRAVLACLDILSRRQSRHAARLSSISKLRGV